MLIANPIYDIVFKYLMEDERIARTILSALLKKDVVKAEARPYKQRSKCDTISMFRADFVVTIREKDGNQRLILVKLQKTWLGTESLCLRQYLGVQYENSRGIENDVYRSSLPIVSVYLLGHQLGDIEEPVLYVRHQSYDYNDKPVTKGLPNPFVDSLTNESIIVQIPRLHGKNNRLDEVLSIFDQTKKYGHNQQMLDIDESQYDINDVEIQQILHCLLMAATNPDILMGMRVEDEYLSILEDRDTTILLKDRQIEQNMQIAEQWSVICTSVKMLHQAGMSAGDIAVNLHLELDQVNEILKQQQ